MKSIKIQHYKCFRTKQGFDDIKKINVIIGKNNIGKSSLLDIIRFYIAPEFRTEIFDKVKEGKPTIFYKGIIEEKSVENVFRKDTTGGEINGNHWNYGQRFLNHSIQYSQEEGQSTRNFVSTDDESLTTDLKKIEKYAQNLAQQQPNLFNGKTFKKLSAERDIKREADNQRVTAISDTGERATNIIQSFINKTQLPSEKVEEVLRAKLNQVYEPDSSFTRILCQLHEDNNWEIFLEEKDKGSIPLSRSGSSLKTVILVLINLLLIPHIENKDLSSYVFAFEELENNLHPSLLRRLLLLIKQMSIENDFTVFLTTHSSIMIDLFSKDKDAQIIHVQKKNDSSICTTVRTYVDNKGILDDLDIRASDILQSNGIIWVEGPSDRIYLNRWIELWTDGKYIEGAHYQCIFYGGRLLSHLDAENPDLFSRTISILNVNRNAAILIDSDKRGKSTPINNTKKRLEKEFSGNNQLAWITKGREIENYIPEEVLEVLIGKKIKKNVGQFNDIFEFIEGEKPGLGTKYKNKKPLLAEFICPLLTKENLIKVLDIKERMNSICQVIQLWN